MGLWVVFYIPDTQPPDDRPEIRCSIVLPPVDAPIIAWEADTAQAAIEQAALTLRVGGTFYATNYDTLIIAENVELQMQAIVPAIRAGGKQ